MSRHEHETLYLPSHKTDTTAAAHLISAFSVLALCICTIYLSMSLSSLSISDILWCQNIAKWFKAGLEMGKKATSPFLTCFGVGGSILHFFASVCVVQPSYSMDMPAPF